MANTVAYEYPVVGATPPTAAQIRTHQTLSCVVTGDGAATTVVITHNWGFSTAELAEGICPEVSFEPILASGNTAAPIVTTKATNTLTLTVTAFTGAGLRVRLARPWTPLR